MEYRKLGHSELAISRLGFGAEPLGGIDWGEVDEKKAMAAVRQAVERGINYFDTADVYGLGRSEIVLSRALGSKRHDVVVGTKFGVNWHDPAPGQRAQVFYDSSPQRVLEALENSLRRLRLDTIPLYYIHWPDPNTPLEETLAVLARCKEAGKIRAIGLSNFSASQISTASQIVEIDAVQVQYNLIDRFAEIEIFPLCKRLGISVFTYGSLAQGLLTGKYGLDTTFAQDDRRHRLTHFQSGQRKAHQKAIDSLRDVAQMYSKEISQVALRWILENPAVTCAIVGAKNPAQVVSNSGAVGWGLGHREMQRLGQGYEQ